MAQIVGTVTVSQSKLDKLTARLLPKTSNPSDLNSEGKPKPFASMDAYASYVLDETLRSYLKILKSDDDATLQAAYDSASPSVQAQVAALLGVA